MRISPLIIFLALQVLDAVSTLGAMAFGGGELNPVVSRIMLIGPVSGLLLSKVIVSGIAVACMRWDKQKAIRIANLAFTGIFVWNCSIVARLAAS